AVGQVRRDGDLAAATDLHAEQALVPALDDLADADLEAQRGAAVPGGVELLAGGPGHADVVRADDRAGNGLVAVTDLDVLDDQLGGRLSAREVDLGLALLAHLVLSVGEVVSRRRGCPRRRRGSPAGARDPRCPRSPARAGSPA